MRLGLGFVLGFVFGLGLGLGLGFGLGFVLGFGIGGSGSVRVRVRVGEDDGVRAHLLPRRTRHPRTGGDAPLIARPRLDAQAVRRLDGLTVPVVLGRRVLRLWRGLLLVPRLEEGTPFHLGAC